MLEPHDRRVLLDALRPPAGYRLDAAIGTTYTLDLIALLATQLSFSVHDVFVDSTDEDTGVPSTGVAAAALLQAVRANADRMVVFCEAGATHVSKYRPLMAYLEKVVVPVVAPMGGTFHPKVWVERFVSVDSDEVLYRVLICTRNLTFDRSWDTMLVLEGKLTTRKNAFSRNRPLSDFVAALPGMAVGGAPKNANTIAARLAAELLVVDFELPAGFDSLEFEAYGHDGISRRLDESVGRRWMIVSPFLDPRLLAQVGRKGTGHVLVSRPEQLDRMSAEVLRPFRCFVLDEQTDGELPDADDLKAPIGSIPRGLHAKLYVVDDGWNARVETGSLNFTTRAFEQNVEFLAVLKGRRSQVGCDAVLEGDGKLGLARVLVPYSPIASPPEVDPVQEQLEQDARDACTALASVVWKAVVTAQPDARYGLRVSANIKPLASEVARVSVRPITVSSDLATTLVIDKRQASAQFNQLSFQALSSFFVFDVTLERGDHTATHSFVLNAKLEGAPEDRQARLLQSILDDREKVLQFLAMLLALEPGRADGEPDDATAVPGAGIARGSGTRAPLLEQLLRALDREPERLVEFEKTVGDLKTAKDGEGLLPPELSAIWEPIWAAYQSTRKRRTSTVREPSADAAPPVSASAPNANATPGSEAATANEEGA